MVTVAASLLSHNRSLFLDIARIVYQETRVSRRNLHAVRGGLRCDASVVVTGGFAVSGDCPCVEEYLEVLVEVVRYLDRQNPAEVGSYGALARSHCRLRAVRDAHRRRNGSRTQQRTDRLAASAIGRALVTDAQRALLRHVVQEAASFASAR
jgi:hypothetical protein